MSLPFGGVPFGVKELERVQGWPSAEASVIFRARVAAQDQTSVTRLRAAGAVLAAQTTASEFGGINCTSTELHGTTRNPSDQSRTPGGSSGGTAAAVAGGLLPLATGSDGGGSIRIPAGFTGLFGLKATYGRVPKGPWAGLQPLTTVMGCLSRSVRDTARYFDCCNGFDQRDPLSLPAVGGWEAGLGRIDLAGKKVAILPDLGDRPGHDEVAEQVAATAALARHGTADRRRQPDPPGPLNGGIDIAAIFFVADLGAAYPDRVQELSSEMRAGLRGGPGALHAGEGGIHRVLPAAAQRSHGRPLRGSRLRSCARPTPMWPSRPRAHRRRRFPGSTSSTSSGSPGPS